MWEALPHSQRLQQELLTRRRACVQSVLSATAMDHPVNAKVALEKMRMVEDLFLDIFHRPMPPFGGES